MVTGIYEGGARTVVLAIAVGEAAGEKLWSSVGVQPLTACKHTGGNLRNKFPVLSFLPAPNWTSVGKGTCLILAIVVSLVGHGAGREAWRVDLEGKLRLSNRGSLRISHQRCLTALLPAVL